MVSIRRLRRLLNHRGRPSVIKSHAKRTSIGDRVPRAARCIEITPFHVKHRPGDGLWFRYAALRAATQPPEVRR